MAWSSSFPRATDSDVGVFAGWLEAVEATSCGRLALWLGMLRKMGIRQVIDRLLPTEAEISHGAVVEAVVLNRLLAPRPLYRIDEWARDCDLGTLIGIDPTRLNDDRVGRTLDALARAERDCQAAVSVRVITTFNLDTTDAHYDTTTAWFEGDYEDSELAARGHTKDGDRRRKQVVIGTVATADGEVPLAQVTVPGNTADVSTVPAMLRALRASVKTDGIVVSGDSVMWSEANRDAVAAAHGVFLGPIAMNPAVVRWVCEATPEVEVFVALARQKAPVLYRACVVGRFAVNGVADAGARIVVLDPRRAVAEADERAAALTRMEDALTGLTAGLNVGRLKKLAAAQKKLAAVQKRHGLAARYLVPTLTEDAGVLALTWSRDANALAEALKRDGRWPLVTNRKGLTDEELCVWAVRRYKGHGRIERDQHLLKGILHVRPLFVQNDDRIRALVMICLWALTAWTLLERAARRTLPKPRKPSPPIARIEGMLHALAVITWRVTGDTTLHRAVTTLHPAVQSLLHGLGIAHEVRAILNEAATVRIQV
jgi:transposase